MLLFSSMPKMTKEMTIIVYSSHSGQEDMEERCKEVEAQTPVAEEVHYSMEHATRDMQVEHTRGWVMAAVGIGDVGMGYFEVANGKAVVAVEEQRTGEADEKEVVAVEEQHTGEADEKDEDEEDERNWGLQAAEEAGRQEIGYAGEGWRDSQGRQVENSVALPKGNYRHLKFQSPEN